MKRFIRLAIAVGAVVFRLRSVARPGGVLAEPVRHRMRNNPGKPTAILLGHIQTAADDPTAKDTIYAPLGYGVNLSQAAGNKIGDVSARLILRNGGNAEVDVDGQRHRRQSRELPGTTSVLPALHQAVWNLNITVAGRRSPFRSTSTQSQPAQRRRSLRRRSSSVSRARSGLLRAPSSTSRSSTSTAFSRTPPTRATGYGARPSRRTWPGRRSRTRPGRPRGRPSFQDESASRWRRRASRRAVVIVSGRLTVDGRPYRGGQVELFVGNGKESARPGRTPAAVHDPHEDQEEDAFARAGALPGGPRAACPAPGYPVCRRAEDRVALLLRLQDRHRQTKR